MSSKELNDISKVYLEAVYGGAKKEAPKDDRMVVTNADKKANTKAYQNMKAGNKAYKAADHLKDNYEFARHKASIISRGGRLEDAVESWNQKLAYREAMKNVSEQKEVDVKDTYKTVAAVIDYDRSKKGSKDADYDSMKGDKKAAKKERDYAAFERGKMKKDDPNWKSKKYHTGMHGEQVELAPKKKKKKGHDCASKVKHEEYGIGNPVKGMHDLDESGRVAHYDVLFGHGVEKNVPVSSLEILEGSMHEHVIYTEQKKAAKDYDGDGKIESGKDEYFGSKDKAIKKAMGKKVKKESLSDWRDDLSDLIEIVAGPENEVEKKVKEGNVKNKVVINPKISEAIEEIGGEVLEHHQKDADGNTVPHDDVEEGKMYGYNGGGKVKKEVKALSTAARTMKGRNVAKADAIEEGHGKKKNCGCGQDPCITYGKQEDVKEAKSAAWQRKEGKRESGGLNQKGVDSYRAANPGSKLKTAVTTKPSKLKKGSKSASRRKSFCARMGGMKKKLTSSKTANDPDSRINKSLRKWNCSYEPDGTPIMEADKAFNTVLAALQKKHGKENIITKKNPMKPQSAADKAKARAHQGKVDKENAAERKKDPSQGRYPKG